MIFRFKIMLTIFSVVVKSSLKLLFYKLRVDCRLGEAECSGPEVGSLRKMGGDRTMWK